MGSKKEEKINSLSFFLFHAHLKVCLDVGNDHFNYLNTRTTWPEV